MLQMKEQAFGCTTWHLMLMMEEEEAVGAQAKKHILSGDFLDPGQLLDGDLDDLREMIVFGDCGNFLDKVDPADEPTLVSVALLISLVFIV